MNHGRTVFAQLIGFLPDRDFRRCVARYDGDSRLREFSCWDQYLTMAFAQLTYRESLRDIEACLRSTSGKLYHVGFRAGWRAPHWADANESRDWRIYADFTQILIGIAWPRGHSFAEVALSFTLAQCADVQPSVVLLYTQFEWRILRSHPHSAKNWDLSCRSSTSGPVASRKGYPSVGKSATPRSPGSVSWVNRAGACIRGSRRSVGRS